MRCPADGSFLQRTRVATTTGFVWACAGCRGRAVAMPVLRRQVDAKALQDVWHRSLIDAKPGVPCPSCANEMAQVSVQFEDETTVLDVCRACHLVWFDPDELERLPPAPAPIAVDDGLTPELRQQLAIAEVEEMVRRSREADDEHPSLRPSRLPALLGMPVELGGHELACRPWATWITAAVVAGVSIAGFAWPEVVERLQLVPDHAFESALATTVTSFFVHASWWHLLSNLWFLVAFGDNVEDLLGRRRWLLLVLTATFAGSIAQMLCDPRSEMPSVGASGGISGLIVFYALAMPHARLGLFVLTGWALPQRGNWVTFSATGGLVAWLALQAWIVVKQLAGVGYVSGLARLGGALVGCLFWLQWRDRPGA